MKIKEIGLGYVYFLGSKEVNRIKIGFSRTPLKRRFDLEVGSPANLDLLAFMPGTIQLERSLHKTFKKYHFRGDWFEASPQIWDFINMVRFDSKALQHFGNPDPIRYMLIERSKVKDILGEENYWKLKKGAEDFENTGI